MGNWIIRKDRSLELKSVFRECPPGRRKIAVKVVDIFGNDTMKVVEVTILKRFEPVKTVNDFIDSPAGMEKLDSV